MKRLLVVTATVCATLALCFTGESQAQEAFELNIGSLAPKGTPWMDMLEQIEKNLEEGSGGRIEVILRPPGQMGEVEMVRETRRGERLQAAAVTTAAIAEGGNVPQLQLVELPFLFDTSEEADYVLDNKLFDPIDELLQRRGFKLGVWSENGWRSFATRSKPIRTPDDLKSFKMRCQESDVHQAMYDTFGAQAVQKPMTEVLTALQANVVDGLDNTALYIKTGGLSEPLDYFTLTRHIYQPAAVIYSKRWYDSLPADLQKLVMDQKGLAASGRAAIREEDAAITELLREDMEVIELTPDERATFKAVALPMHQTFAASVEGTDLLKTINDALTEYRSK